jgi:hypothetical protein
MSEENEALAHRFHIDIFQKGDLAAALGLLGVIAVDTINIQKVDAAGCRTSIAYNASQGRCFNH